VVEAARGTLFHHYTLDHHGLVEKANLIVATTNNAGAITMSVRDAAKGVIKKGHVTEGLLNKVEMAFRAYDPCFGCATHTLPGGMPLTVDIYDHQKKLTHSISRT
jgi:F420-non-reducing hydrogenase large subunit